MILKLLNVPDTFVKIKKQNKTTIYIFFYNFDHYHIRCATIESQCFAMKKATTNTTKFTDTNPKQKEKKK